MNLPPLAQKIFGYLLIIVGVHSFMQGKIVRAGGLILATNIWHARITATLAIIAGIILVVGKNK